MNDILAGKTDGLLAVIGSGGAMTLDQPFSQEIYLTSFHVAGTFYAENIKEHSMALRPGDQVVLFREPENEHDVYATLIKDAQGHKLGYMPAKMNHMPARLMDAGKLLYCKVIEVAESESGYIDIHLGMYLKD